MECTLLRLELETIYDEVVPGSQLTAVRSPGIPRAPWRCSLVVKVGHRRTMLGYKLFEGIRNTSWHTYLPFVLISENKLV